MTLYVISLPGCVLELIKTMLSVDPILYSLVLSFFVLLLRKALQSMERLPPVHVRTSLSSALFLS